MKSNFLRQFYRKGYGTVALIWLFFELAWFVYLGVHFDLEAQKYISEAQFILEHHHFSEARYLFYFSTTAVIAFCKVAGLGLYGALLMIMAFNLFSCLVFFRALNVLFKNRLLGYAVMVLLLSFWPYQSWTLYLYTECFFYSAVLLLLSHLILYKNLNVRFLLIAFFLLLLVVLSRPLGILFVFPMLLFIFLKLSKKQKVFFAVVGVVSFLLFNYTVQTVLTTTSDWSLRKTILEADIICDMPGPASAGSLDLSSNPNQLYQLVYYIMHNFSHFLSLALLRLRYFFLMIRTYYSFSHNAYLVTYLLLIYGCMLIGVKKIVTFFPSALSWFIFSSLVLFSLTIALQCDDYHNRFFLTLMPFFMTMVVVVLRPLIIRLSFLRSKLSAPGKLQ